MGDPKGVLFSRLFKFLLLRFSFAYFLVFGTLMADFFLVGLLFACRLIRLACFGFLLVRLKIKKDLIGVSVLNA